MKNPQQESARVIGTPRFRHWTDSGLYLEKSMVYMLPSQWIQLGAAAKFLNISPSMYLSLLVDEDMERHTSRLKGSHVYN